MKIIDLLNKIAKGEEVPQNIKYNDLIWFWCEGCQIYETNNEDGKCINLYSWFTTEGNLNDEVENLEEVEDKEYENIQELKNKRFTRNQKQIAGKINQIIRNQQKIIERINKEVNND
jgi:hypothetical protein